MMRLGEDGHVAMMQRGWIMLGSQHPKLLNLPVDAAFDDAVFDAFMSDVRAICNDLRNGRSDAESNLSYGWADRVGVWRVCGNDHVDGMRAHVHRR